MNPQLPRFRLSLDPWLLIPALVLGVTGILFIYSSGINSLGVNTSNEYLRQIIWVIIGVMVFVTASLIKYYHYREWAWFIMVGGALLVIASLLFGRVINGARSWLGIGELGIQPSEFMKIAYMVFAASMMERYKNQLGDLRQFIFHLAILVVPVGLIMLQPDFGTAMVFFPIFLTMMFFAGGRRRHIAFMVGIALVGAVLILIPAWDLYINQDSLGIADVMRRLTFMIPVGVFLVITIAVALVAYRRLKQPVFYWLAYGATILLLAFVMAEAALRVFKEYQMLRLVVFLDPNIDPRGSGWHIIQSLTAVGSGGFSGKGFLEGTQSHYKFLPEQSTDFIFSIISEEWGFLGGVVILGCYSVILGRGLVILRHSRDVFSTSLVGGVMGLLFFHMMVNIGMTIGLMPITGIPLLLVSYGGSSMLSAMLGLGLMSSVNAHRHTF